MPAVVVADERGSAAGERAAARPTSRASCRASCPIRTGASVGPLDLVVRDHRAVRLQRAVDQLRRTRRGRRPIAPAGSASTSRCSSRSRAHAAAEPVRRSSVGQRPPLGLPARRRRARAPAPCRRASSPRARARARVQASTDTAATGLRLCGHRRRAPPRALAPSRDLACASSVTSRAIFASAPASSAQRARRARGAHAVRCATAAPARRARAAARPRRATAGIAVADRPAHLHGERRAAAASAQRLVDRRSSSRPPSARTTSAARAAAACGAMHRRVAVRVGQRRGGVRRRARRRRASGSSARLATSIIAVSRMSWRRRAARACSLRSRAARAARRGEACVGARSTRRAAREVDRPAASQLRSPPSAASTSSIACSHASSLTGGGDRRRARRCRRTAQTSKKTVSSRRLGSGCRIGSHRRSRSAQQRVTPVGRDARPAPGRRRSKQIRVVEVAQQPAREDVDGEVAAPRGTHDVPAAVVVGRGSARTPAGRAARSRPARRGPARRRRRATRPAMRTPSGSATGPSSHGSPIARYGPTVCDGRRRHQRSSIGVRRVRQHDVELVGERPVLLRCASMLNAADHPLARASGRAPS